MWRGVHKVLLNGKSMLPKNVERIVSLGSVLVITLNIQILSEYNLNYQLVIWR